MPTGAINIIYVYRHDEFGCWSRNVTVHLRGRLEDVGGEEFIVSGDASFRLNELVLIQDLYRTYAQLDIEQEFTISR